VTKTVREPADPELVRLALLHAERLDRRLDPAANVIRRLARIVATTAPKLDDGCERCGAPVEQLGRGRPRRFCTTCSPRKNPEKAIVKVTASPRRS
jgi:hypothetical protein